MGTDIHSFLEVKNSYTKHWLVVGKNLTVEHFDLDKECPELGVSFSMGNMNNNWRDANEYWREWLENYKQNPKYEAIFRFQCPPRNIWERILFQDYVALQNGHKSGDERIVSPIDWRSYIMFGILANCHYEEDEIEAIASPKGWPKIPSDFGILRNIWFQSKKIHDEDDYYIVTDGDLHHISYLTIEEIERWLEDPLSHAKTPEVRKEFEDYYIKYITELKNELKKLMSLPTIEDVRIVFGFES